MMICQYSLEFYNLKDSLKLSTMDMKYHFYNVDANL